MHFAWMSGSSLRKDNAQNVACEISQHSSGTKNRLIGKRFAHRGLDSFCPARRGCNILTTERHPRRALLADSVKAWLFIPPAMLPSD